MNLVLIFLVEITRQGLLFYIIIWNLFIIILIEKYENLKSCFKIKSLTNKLGIISNDDLIDTLVSYFDQSYADKDLDTCVNPSLI